MEPLTDMLQVRNDFPNGLLTCDAKDLYRYFSGPTLLHLPGHRSPAFFLSILLHGNEDVGLKAVQQVLSKYGRKSLPRELLLFIGNPEAARIGVRMLPHQEDFNRVWPGTNHPASAFSECMRQVVEYASRVGVSVSVDLHNNTGTNPLYSCIESIDARTLQLALLFSRTIVYFRTPLGVQTGAMSKLCPSITCECGRVGDEVGVQRAIELIEACLHMLELPQHWPAKSDYNLLHSIATVKIDPEWTIAFDENDASADLRFATDFDKWNFRSLPAGTELGKRRTGSQAQLSILNDRNQDITSSLIELRDNAFVLSRTVIPAMLTTKIPIVHADCLGYFMEPM